jgi:hypothetical protein
MEFRSATIRDFRHLRDNEFFPLLDAWCPIATVPTVQRYRRDLFR